MTYNLPRRRTTWQLRSRVLTVLRELTTFMTTSIFWNIDSVIDCLMSKVKRRIHTKFRILQAHNSHWVPYANIADDSPRHNRSAQVF